MIRYNQLRNTYTKISYIKRNNSWLELSEPTMKPNPFHEFKRKKEPEEIEICKKCYMIKSLNGSCGCEE